MKKLSNHSTFWKHKRVVVTGGRGFVGSYVTSLLQELHAVDIIVPEHKTCDLREYSDCVAVCHNADIVIHLAGNVGGIGYNRLFPATIFDDNIRMGVNMHRAAHDCNVGKFVGLGSVCAYPSITPVPFREEDVWDGYPEETNAAYGLAKKMLLVASQAYRKQYGMNAIHLLSANMYGPGDSFDPHASHVIPSLIRIMVEAIVSRTRVVTLWGTGRATREFLYVEDAARAIVGAAEQYDGYLPVNIGSGVEISIEKLAQTIASITGFTGSILFDPTKPDGQLRRSLDTTKAWKLFGFRAREPLETGLSKTISWYRKHTSGLSH